MGKVLPFERPTLTRCQCGWRLPDDFEIKMTRPSTALVKIEEILYRCPECGQGMIHEWQDAK